MLRSPVQLVEAIIPRLGHGGPLVIDIEAQALPEDQWILEGVSLQGMMSVAPPSTDDWKFPVSGLWLIPPFTETETAADAAAKLNLRTRPVPIPLSPDTGIRTYGANVFPDWFAAFGMIGQSGFQVSVPGGWSIRGIFCPFPGVDTTPGPGSETYAKLTAMIRVMRNLEVYNGD